MKALVISVHPDDEALGCAGTILKHKERKEEVGWLIITNVAKEHGYSDSQVSARKDEVKRAYKELGFDYMENLNYAPMGLEPSLLGKLVKEISDVFNKYKPELIYLPNRSDAHSDHRITFDAVMACTKSFRYPYIKQVMMYECISETEFAPALPEKVFIPNYFVDISLYLKKKLDILEIYESELGPHPFPRNGRNVEALATFRGATVGVEYAEAFSLIKYIDK
jgi:LmbE family N-acetylglucosaminyl deacetylase